MNRRYFVQSGLMTWLSLSFLPVFNCKNRKQAVMKRKLGRHDEYLSVLGFGGIVIDKEEQSIANEAVAKAFERGINYFDVAPTYGNAEDKLGPALKPYRKYSFLACKTQERSRAGAEKELNNSLAKLKTDYFDLYQLHAITSVEDVEKAFGPDGAMELFIKAKQDGKIRYLGFSAHSEEAALLAMDKFDFDTILFPINFVCWYEGNFGPRVVEKAKEKNMGILALKSLAYSQLRDRNNNPYNKLWYQPVDLTNDDLIKKALSFTLSQSVTAAIPPGQPEYFWKALDLVSSIKDLSAEQIKQLKDLSKEATPLFSS